MAKSEHNKFFNFKELYNYLNNKKIYESVHFVAICKNKIIKDLRIVIINLN